MRLSAEEGQGVVADVAPEYSDVVLEVASWGEDEGVAGEEAWQRLRQRGYSERDTGRIMSEAADVIMQTAKAMQAHGEYIQLLRAVGWR